MFLRWPSYSFLSLDVDYSVLPTFTLSTSIYNHVEHGYASRELRCIAEFDRSVALDQAKNGSTGNVCLIFALLFIVGAFLYNLPAVLSDETPQPVLAWKPATQGAFITASCLDKAGNTWVGTEGNGLWKYSRADNRWISCNPSDQSEQQVSNCVCSLACDRLGRIWVGGYNGVSVYNGTSWRRYDRSNGPLGDHVTAIAVEPISGNIFLATDAGVSEYEIEAAAWRYISYSDGLPSNQISALTFDPLGNLYVGTDCDGIAVSSKSTGYTHWRCTSGPDIPLNVGCGKGLPSGEINVLSCAADGTVYAGTSAGLCWTADQGSTWNYIRGADWLDKGSGQDDTNLRGDPVLAGLSVTAGHLGTSVNWKPGNHDPRVSVYGGRIVVAGGNPDTSSQPSLSQAALNGQLIGNSSIVLNGLAAGAQYAMTLYFANANSNSNGHTVLSVFVNGLPVLEDVDIFKFAKTRGRLVPFSVTVASDDTGRLVLQMQGGSVPGNSADRPPCLLAEDSVEAIVQNPAGGLTVGFDHEGVETLNSKPGYIQSSSTITPTDVSVRSFVPIAPGCIICGTYGGGLKNLVDFGASSGDTTADETGNVVADKDADFPESAAPPTAAALRGICNLIQSRSSSVLLSPGAFYLGQDWQTQGDWVGRYGNKYVILLSECSPTDEILPDDAAYAVSGSVGVHAKIVDCVRRYLRRWANPESLYDPIRGTATQAEWDDHGEAYPAELQGPDLLMSITIPSGSHCLSLYFINPDAHSSNPPHRDYLVQIVASGGPGHLIRSGYMAHCRVRNFWTGVYAQFLLAGSGQYQVVIGRSGSSNTVCSGVFLDKLPLDSVTNSGVAGMLGGTYYAPADQDMPDLFPDPGQKIDKPSIDIAKKVWQLTASVQDAKSTDLDNRIRVAAYRSAVSSGASRALRQSWRWQLGIWSSEDRIDFTNTMQSDWKALQAVNAAVVWQSGQH